MKDKELIAFILEREAVRVNRRSGMLKPWTRDPILQRFRFCNVNRNNDTVTRWIHNNWLKPLQNDPDAWFAMAVARLVNWPDSLDPATPSVIADGRAVWRPQRFVAALDARRERGDKVFTGAYMIHADATHSGSKAAYLAERVLGPMWGARKLIRPREGDSLHQFACRLLPQRDMGTFMVGQIVADTKQVGVLRDASDYATWAISGPGSKRGLNRVFDRDINAKWKEEDWKEHLDYLGTLIGPTLFRNKVAVDGQDLQNCLCEFDKYERVRLGQGTPRSSYPGV